VAVTAAEGPEGEESAGSGADAVAVTAAEDPEGGESAGSGADAVAVSAAEGPEGGESAGATVKTGASEADEIVEAVARLISGPPPEGRPTWSGRTVAKVLGISRWHADRALKDLRLRAGSAAGEARARGGGDKRGPVRPEGGGLPPWLPVASGDVPCFRDAGDMRVLERLAVGGGLILKRALAALAVARGMSVGDAALELGRSDEWVSRWARSFEAEGPVGLLGPEHGSLFGDGAADGPQAPPATDGRESPAARTSGSGEARLPDRESHAPAPLAVAEAGPGRLPVKPSPEEKVRAADMGLAELELLTRAAGAPANARMRGKAVLEVLRGASAKATAGRLKLAEKTVANWISAFRREGPPALGLAAGTAPPALSIAARRTMIDLGAGDLASLAEWAGGGAPHADAESRARVVKAVMDGAKPTDVAVVFGIPVAIVYGWMGRFGRRGTAGLGEVSRRETDWPVGESGELGTESGREAGEVSGQEAGESGQEAGESGQEAGESGQEAGEAGQEAGEAGQEAGEVSGQEAGEAGQEAGEAGQEAGESGQEAGESGQEAREPGEEAGESGLGFVPEAGEPGTEFEELDADAGQESGEEFVPEAGEPGAVFEELEADAGEEFDELEADAEEESGEFEAEAGQESGELEADAGEESGELEDDEAWEKLELEADELELESVDWDELEYGLEDEDFEAVGAEEEGEGCEAVGAEEEGEDCEAVGAEEEGEGFEAVGAEEEGEG
jgi:transposase